MFVGIYGINTFYSKGPDYNDFCPQYLGNETACAAVGGNWAASGTEVMNGKPAPVGNYCDYDYSICQKNYDNADEKYWKTVFFIALPLGIVILAVGALIFGLEFVGAGLMFGGVGIIIYGVGGFWRFAQDWLKFTLSLIGLVIVIYIGYWFNKRMRR
jgi:hypothetical protein